MFEINQSIDKICINISNIIFICFSSQNVVSLLSETNFKQIIFCLFSVQPGGGSGPAGLGRVSGDGGDPSGADVRSHGGQSNPPRCHRSAAVAPVCGFLSASVRPEASADAPPPGGAALPGHSQPPPGGGAAGGAGDAAAGGGAASGSEDAAHRSGRGGRRPGAGEGVPAAADWLVVSRFTCSARGRSPAGGWPLLDGAWSSFFSIM